MVAFFYGFRHLVGMQFPHYDLADRVFGAFRTGSFLVTTLALVTSINAQTVFTSPAGYVKLKAIAAASSSDPSFNFVNHALAQKRKSVGEVTAGGTDVITSSSSSWTADQFAGSEGPHFVLITSGSLEGQMYDIASNSTDTLTLAQGSGDTSTLVGAIFQIYQHNTLSSMFSSDPEAKGVMGGLTSSSADQVILYDVESSGFKTFFFKNDAPPFSGEIDNDWVEDDQFSTSAALTVIPPNQGFIYLRRDETSPLEVTLFGDVITSAVSVAIVPGFNLLAVPAPVDTNVTLGSSGLRPAVGETEDLAIHLEGGLTSTEAETIFIYDNATESYQSYFFRNDAPPFSGEIDNDWVEDNLFTVSAAGTSLNGGSFFIARKAENATLNWVFPSVIPETNP